MEVSLGIEDGIEGNLARDRGPPGKGFVAGLDFVSLPFRISFDLLKDGFLLGSSGQIRMRGLRSELERAEEAHQTILNLQESPGVGVIVVEGKGKSRIVPKNGPGH